MSAPAVRIDLDIAAVSRPFRLEFAEGTTPLYRVYLYNNGAAFTTTGWTGTLYLQTSWEATSVIAIASTSTTSTYIDFQLTTTHTADPGAYEANFIFTDATTTHEWSRGKVQINDSPGTDGGTAADLSTPLAWTGFQYSNTGTSGPYRAGDNVTFETNADGSVDINAATGAVSDGSITTAKLADGAVTAAKMASNAVTTAKIENSAVTLAKMADLATAHLIGRHAGSTGTPQSVAIDGGLELSGANLRRSALTGDVLASAGSNATALANSGVTAGSYTNASVTFDAKGRATAASSGEACLPLSGGTVNGDIEVNGTVGEAGGTTIFVGVASGLTAIPATQLTGDIPAASFGSLTVECHGRDLVLTTSAEVGWTGYEVDNATRTFSADAVTSANTSAQTFVLRSLPLKVPRGFVAFKTTGAIVIEWIADDTSVAKITGIELISYNDMTGAKTTLYTNSDTRNVTTINVPSVVSINRSAFSDQTVQTHLVLEITGTVEDSKKLAILHAEIVSE